MKTLEEIIKQEPVYMYQFRSKMDVIKQFDDRYYFTDHEEEKLLEEYSNVNILFAFYSYEDYSGEAFVLFEEDGKLYEVNGSHCSCYGLENQWIPYEVTLEELEHRLIKGSMGRSYYDGDKYSIELIEFLGVEGDVQEDTF